MSLTQWGLGLMFFNLLLICMSDKLWAKDVPLKVGTATFSFHAEESFVPKAFRERLSEDWSNFCEAFGSNILVGKGPQGRGIANKFECSKIQFVSDTSDLKPSENWSFHFGWKASGLSLSLYFRGKDQKSFFLVDRVEFPKQFSPDLLFSSPEATFYVLSRMYRRLPVAWNATFAKADLQWQLQPLATQSLGVMAPARKIGLFALRLDPSSKTWVPVLYAIAQPLVSDENKKEFDREGVEPLELRWIIEPKQKQIRLWAQEIYNPLEKEVDPSFLTMRSGKNGGTLLEGYALEGLKSDTISLRYGVPVPKGTTIVSQAPKVELMGQIGKGMFEGLTFGYETSPKQVQTEGEDTYSYSWSRIEAGWSFSLGQPQTIDRFATRFKLAPKLGILNMEAYFPLTASENLEFATVAAFQVKNQVEFGGELSWELESLSYRVKAWATAHISGYVLGGDDVTKVSNQRAGADISYDLWKSGGGLRIGALAFGYVDWVTVQKNTSSQLGLNLAASTTASGASYNVTYMGAGLSVTW